MSLLEDVKRISEKATAWERRKRQLLRDRQPQTYRFKDDGLIPNHPKWPLVIYKSVVRLPQSLDPAAVFEELFEKKRIGGRFLARRYLRLRSLSVVARGNGRVQFVGPKGRTLVLKAGDIDPASRHRSPVH